jgi:hypothetical protein
MRIDGHVVFNAVRVVSRKAGDQFFPELLVKIHFQNIPGGPSHLLRRSSVPRAIV